MKKTLRPIPLILFVLALTSVYAGVLDRFADPPRAYRPETWLQVSDGNAGKEGMSRDLEAIASAGFMGVQFFQEGFRSKGPWPGTTEQIPCMSEHWEEFISHTAHECRRLGLRFLMHGCPGWSMAGGPWVPDDKAMRELVFSRVETAAGAAVSVPRPAKADDAPWRDYRDIAVVAFPTPVGDVVEPLVPAAVAETNANERVLVRTYSFGAPVTVRTLELSPVQRLNHTWSFVPSVEVALDVRLEAGWRELARWQMPQSTWQDEKPLSLAVPTTTAAAFRLTYVHAHPIVESSARFFSGARPANYEAEAAQVLRALMPGGDAPVAPGEAVDPGSVVDLTDKLGADGQLAWTAPSGRWTVLRIGNVNAGIKNHPAPPEATGWECDKLSTAGADASYDGYIGKLSAGALSDGLLGGLLMDSWECEAQTWTPGLDLTFARRWGYGLERWWPALVGYVVKDRRATSLFYRDWRELLGDLVFDNFYGHLSGRAHANGQFVTYETCGGDVFPGDAMKHWKHADEPMCEFWRPRSKAGGCGSVDYKPIRPCVSAARIYGKRRVSAEALCCTALDWRTEYPRAWKADLDYYMALGVTHMVFEDFTHDPRIGYLPPGTGYADVMGTVLNRHQAWWDHMREVTDYLTRCSCLLESGRSTSDVLLYLGDRLDHKLPHDLPFPKGYSYDYLNKDAFLTRIDVKDGLWTTPEGLTWKALWLYDAKDLRPETSAKLAACERQGGKVIRGDVFAGVAALGLKPQVRRDGGLLWQHRTTDSEEIYFFAEEDGKPFDGRVEVAGTGEAFIADPVTGKVEPADEVSFSDGYATVSLTLAQSGARFVVIRRGEPKARSVKRPAPVVRELAGTWRLAFEKGWGRDEPVTTDRLVSWRELPGTEEQKSYSGKVVYAFEFDCDAETAAAKGVALDLGTVETSAEVVLNGRNLGIRWTWPYAIDATGALKSGRNRLEVTVASSWHNRLRYDATLPEKDRKTWTLGFPDPAKSPLQPSGLIGPVRIVR